MIFALSRATSASAPAFPESRPVAPLVMSPSSEARGSLGGRGFIDETAPTAAIAVLRRLTACVAICARPSAKRDLEQE